MKYYIQSKYYDRWVFASMNQELYEFNSLETAQEKLEKLKSDIVTSCFQWRIVEIKVIE